MELVVKNGMTLDLKLEIIGSIKLLINIYVVLVGISLNLLSSIKLE